MTELNPSTHVRYAELRTDTRAWTPLVKLVAGKHVVQREIDYATSVVEAWSARHPEYEQVAS